MGGDEASSLLGFTAGIRSHRTCGRRVSGQSPGHPPVSCSGPCPVQEEVRVRGYEGGRC